MAVDVSAVPIQLSGILNGTGLWNRPEVYSTVLFHSTQLESVDSDVHSCACMLCASRRSRSFVCLVCLCTGALSTRLEREFRDQLVECSLDVWSGAHSGVSDFFVSSDSIVHLVLINRQAQS